MKKWIPLAALLYSAVTYGAEPFSAAQEDYDAGRYAEAAAGFQSLIDLGIDNIEVHYNLANAHFKAGNLPDAVQHYRYAWYSAPRDPDIRANLRFALNAAGAAAPGASLLERFTHSLSRQEWTALLVASYLAVIALLILALCFRRAGRTLSRAALIPAALLLLALGSRHMWIQFEQHPEAVISRTEATALFGPIEGSTAHFTAPMGALVRQIAVDPKGWVEIEYDNKRGWLRESYIQRVSP